MRKADYKSRGDVTLRNASRQGLIASSWDVKNYAPTDDAVPFADGTQKQRWVMRRVLLQRIPRHHLVRLTRPGDLLYLLHGKSIRFRNHIAPQNCLRSSALVNHIFSSELFWHLSLIYTRFKAEYNKFIFRRDDKILIWFLAINFIVFL